MLTEIWQQHQSADESKEIPEEMLQHAAFLRCVSEDDGSAEAKVSDDENSEFVLTKIHQQVRMELLNLLKIHKFRRSLNDDSPDILKYGGISGLLIQGPSGVGKSTLVRKTLKEQGFIEAKLDDNVCSERQVFYSILASCHLNTMKGVPMQTKHSKPGCELGKSRQRCFLAQIQLPLLTLKFYQQQK